MAVSHEILVRENLIRFEIDHFYDKLNISIYNA